MLTIGSFSLQAQTTNEEISLPDPMQGLESSFYPVWKKPMQSFVCIIGHDTVSKTIFSREGYETERLEYNKGNVLYRSVHQYHRGRKQQTLFYVSDRLQSKTSYRYDASGNLLEWKRLNLQYDKTNRLTGEKTDVHWQYRYNQRKRIAEKFRLDLGPAAIPAFAYIYDDSNRVTEINEPQWKDIYTYEQRRLVSKQRFFKPDQSLYASNSYQYNAEGLLEASTDKFYKRSFVYEAGRLHQIGCRRQADSTYQTITFQYERSLLHSVHIEATDLYLMPAFLIASDYFYSSWKSKSVNRLQYDFLYDAHQNITEIRYTVNDRYLYSKQFVYTYFP
jgi:YD repeat-containing protein